MTSPAVRSIRRYAESAMEESATIEHKMAILRTMINTLMDDYSALRDQRDRARFEARSALSNAQAIAREERGIK